MRAAFAASRAGDFVRAVRDYERFIASSYASETTLKTLEQTNRTDYQRRVDFIALALAEEATTAYAFFDYGAAAEVNLRIATHPRLPLEKRVDGGKNALFLFSALGNRPKLLAANATLQKWTMTPNIRANVDYIVANFEYGVAPGSSNAINALSTSYNIYNGHSVAAKYLVEAAWRIARIKKAAGDAGHHDWYKNTVNAWTLLHDTAPADANRSPFNDYAAEAEFVPLDEEIRASFDYDTGHEQYVKLYPGQIFRSLNPVGAPVRPGAYEDDAKSAYAFGNKLQHVLETYQSLDWSPAALARMGTLYDSLRTGLYYCGGSQFHYFTPQQQAQMTAMRNSGNPLLIDAADAMEASIRHGWRARRDAEIDGADVVMIRYYAQSASLAKTYNVHDAWTAHALNRLAYLTGIISDREMATYVNNTSSPLHPAAKRLVYSDGMYLRMRAALPIAELPNGVAPTRPLPSP